MVDPSVCPPKADVELADIVRRFGPQYISQYGHRMMPSQKRALSDIAACCTKELGGRRYRCDDCHDTFWHYHCCRNRACPKCHGSQTRQWLKERQADLLPCDYFHAVVTVPKELRAAFRRNQKLLYGLLMQVSATAVKDLCAHKRHLGGLPGRLSVLHTWNGQLGYHPHVHLLITGGGITGDGQHWEPARGEFLVPVAVLSRKIAAQFRAALKAKAPAIFPDIPAGVWQRKLIRRSRHLAPCFSANEGTASLTLRASSAISHKNRGRFASNAPTKHTTTVRSAPLPPIPRRSASSKRLFSSASR
jgi:Transposase zinc-binding domain/Putative transposase